MWIKSIINIFVTNCIFSLTLLIQGVDDVHAQVQMNNPGYDDKLVHFGITLGGNISNFKVKLNEFMLTNDSVYVAESAYGPGFNLGIISDLRIGKYFNLRFIPALSFAEKRLIYQLANREVVSKTIESTYLDFPLHLKFKSQRQGNFRMYVLGGIKYALDLASNAEARNAPDQVKITRNDFTLDSGVGCDWYFPMFKFSLEVKFSHGLYDVLVYEPALIYSRVLQRLFSRTLLISMHFE